MPEEIVSGIKELSEIPSEKSDEKPAEEEHVWGIRWVHDGV